MTMNNRGRLKLKFGDWFNLTNERIIKMRDREIHELFKLKLVTRHVNQESQLDWYVLKLDRGFS